MADGPGKIFLWVGGTLLCGFLLFGALVGYYLWQIKQGKSVGLDRQFNQSAFTLSPGASQAARPTVDPTTLAAAIRSDSPTRGPRDAQVTIVAFIDFECPFCQASYPITTKVFDRYEPVARIVFKHLPLESLHPQAMSASLAAACAGEQQKFWEYYDRLFVTKQLDDASLLTQAAALKLNMTAFESCLSTEKYRPQIEKDIEDAARLGVRGTPTYFINNVKVEGVATESTWDTLMLEALKS